MSHGGPSGTEPSGAPFSALHPNPESLSTDSLTASEQNHTTSGVGGQTRSESGRTNSSSEDGRIRILKELEESVESFRQGQVSKTDAISSILRILGANVDVSLSQPQKEATFDSYLTEILAIQSSLDESAATRDAGHVAPGQTSDPYPRRESGKSKPADDSEDEDGDARTPKCQRLLESEMPWYTPPDDASQSHSNPSCAETCRLLRAYNRDISKAKFFVKVATNSPAGIPSSQWERILKGDSIDLNQVFSSLHHVIPDEERTGRMGDTEISFGVSEAKKRISTAAEWAAAWRRASKAICFAFPHRKEELNDYGDYIRKITHFCHTFFWCTRKKCTSLAEKLAS